MGFYVRKAISFGPLALTSQSQVSECRLESRVRGLLQAREERTSTWDATVSITGSDSM
jgi:hypothetical protein